MSSIADMLAQQAGVEVKLPNMGSTADLLAQRASVEVKLQNAVQTRKEAEALKRQTLEKKALHDQKWQQRQYEKACIAQSQPVSGGPGRLSEPGNKPDLDAQVKPRAGIAAVERAAVKANKAKANAQAVHAAIEENTRKQREADYKASQEAWQDKVQAKKRDAQEESRLQAEAVKRDALQRDALNAASNMRRRQIAQERLENEAKRKQDEEASLRTERKSLLEYRTQVQQEHARKQSEEEQRLKAEAAEAAAEAGRVRQEDSTSPSPLPSPPPSPSPSPSLSPSTSPTPTPTPSPAPTPTPTPHP